MKRNIDILSGRQTGVLPVFFSDNGGHPRWADRPQAHVP
jgi:hypothetical protein